MNTRTGVIYSPETLSDYSLERTVLCGQSFRWRDFSDNSFGTVLTINQTDVPVVVRQTSPRRIQYETEIPTGAEITGFDVERELKKRLGFHYDYKSFVDSIRSIDPELASEVSLSLTQDSPYECLFSFLCSPQATVKRIRDMQRRIENRWGTRHTLRDGKVINSYPISSVLSATTVEKLKEENLGYRAEYVQRSAEQVESGEVELPSQDTTISTEELRTRLEQLHGVGRKVSACVALYGYGRTTVVPVDTRINSIVSQRYGRTEASEIESVFADWFGQAAGFAQLLLYELGGEQ